MALMGIARSREYRPLPFRVHLLSLVIGIVLPALIVAALLVRRVVNDNRAAVDRQLVEAARAEAAMVDGERRALVVPGASGSLPARPADVVRGHRIAA
jgi:hypothetical protein